MLITKDILELLKSARTITVGRDHLALTLPNTFNQSTLLPLNPYSDIHINGFSSFSPLPENVSVSAALIFSALSIFQLVQDGDQIDFLFWPDNNSPTMTEHGVTADTLFLRLTREGLPETLKFHLTTTVAPHHSSARLVRGLPVKKAA